MAAGLDVLPATTRSAEAAGAYEAAVVSLAAGRSDVHTHAQRAVDADPNLAMGWIVLSILDRQASRLADAIEKVQRARACSGLSEREDGTIRFFEQFGRDRRAAEATAIEHLRAHPRDHLVVLYVHFLYNLFLDERDRRDRHVHLCRSLAAHWPEDDWFLMAELAFAETETGNHERSLELSRAAHELRPDAGVVAHGFAHALLETGRADEGMSWLHDWLDRWGDGANQACHLTWHHALFALAAGDEQAVATRLDQILGYAGRSVSALSDGSSLLWRLHLDGRSLGDLPWQALSALPSPPGVMFSNLHRAFVLAGLGDVDELRAYAATLTGPVVQVCLALADLVADEPKLAADRLLEHEADFVTIGGSRAQLEVVDDTLIASLARSGRVKEARTRLSARLATRASRRDESWLPSLNGG